LIFQFATIYAITRPRACTQDAIKINSTTIMASQNSFDRMRIINATKQWTAMLVVVNADN
jgi:hypothetical protein